MGNIEILDKQTLPQRAELLLRKWQDANDDTDIEFRLGKTEAGDPALLIAVGETMIPFTKLEGMSLLVVLHVAKNRSPGLEMLEAGVKMAVEALP